MISSFLLVPLVVFGIGLVIFVHELGHYMAARWCGARVETFSLGFGPKLVGWHRNGTLFQIAVVPLGIIDDPAPMTPVEHIWTADKARWATIHDDLPRHEAYPPGVAD